MKVILLDNIKGVGQIGDIKNVKDGYGRNFLLPRGLAKLATKGAEKEIETLKKKRVVLLEKEQKQVTEAVEKLKDAVLEISAPASETGTLFAAVGRKDLVKQIKETCGVILNLETVQLQEPLKEVGEHTVDLKLNKETTVQIKVVIKAEK
jgi:large subunit ribosomal protein L9